MLSTVISKAGGAAGGFVFAGRGADGPTSNRIKRSAADRLPGTQQAFMRPSGSPPRRADPFYCGICKPNLRCFGKLFKLRKLVTLLFLLGGGFAFYYFVLRGGCGTRGAVPCPDPALEEGVGVVLKASQVCVGSGYLCADGRTFQVGRWSLQLGKLRVRATTPEFLSGSIASDVRDAVVEGILAWDGHPFPIVVDSHDYTFRLWDIGVVWTEGLYSGAAGNAHRYITMEGKRFSWSNPEMAVTVPPNLTMDDLLLARVKAIATHEMGHALGLGHSDHQGDIMYPSFNERSVRELRVTARDYQTVEALYSLPNGASVAP